MARKKNKSKDNKKELGNLNLKPVEIEAPKKKEENPQEREEKDSEKDEFENDFKSRPSSGVSWNMPSFRAPVLNSESPSASAEPENLESQVKTAPVSAEAAERAVKEEVYVVKSAAKYEANAGDYSVGRIYESFREEAEEITRAKERGMAGTRIIQNPVRAPVLEETRAIDIGAWQVEHPMASRTSAKEAFSAPEEEYQVLGKKEIRRRTKLPFEE